MPLAAAFIRTLLVYVLVGPFAGFLALALFGYGLLLGQIAWSNIEFYLLHSLECGRLSGGDCVYLKPSVDMLLSIEWRKLAMAVVASYVVGFLPALLAGLLVAQAMLLAGNAVRFWHVLALGCLVGVIFSTIISTGYTLHGAHFFQGCAFLVYLCMFATIICWLPVRRWWPPPGSESAWQA